MSRASRKRQHWSVPSAAMVAVATLLGSCAEQPDAPTSVTHIPAAPSFSQVPCPDCGERHPTPDELWHLHELIDEKVRGCGGSAWEAVADGLISSLYSGRLLIFDQNEDPENWGHWIQFQDGTNRIYISDGHWGGGFLDLTNLNEGEIGETLRHEGVHDWLESTYHDSAFFNQMSTCMAW